MPTNFRAHIRKVFQGFEVYLYILAKRMNLTRVSQMLASHAIKIMLLDSRDEFGLQARVIPGPNGGPLYSLGCSPTAAGDILKADEGSDFPNIYPGDLPPDGSEGVFIADLGVSYNIKSMIATLPTMEALWYYYRGHDPDPDPGGKDFSVDQVGPLMRSSVYNLDDFDHDGNPDHNDDGDSTFFTYGA